MKQNKPQQQEPSFQPMHKHIEASEKEYIFYIPPGMKFSDIYIDLAELCRELNFSRRVITNMRAAGELSCTAFSHGKTQFFKAEIFEILQANTVIGKNSLMNKPGAFPFSIPQGIKLSDIYIDLQEVSMELNCSKRVVSNMRTAGELSYTTLNHGKCFYFKQEIAERLKANTVIGKYSLMNKPGFNRMMSKIAFLVSLLSSDAPVLLFC
jgi:hypothetical protein